MSRIWGKIADFFRETDKVLLLLCVCASLYGSMMVLSTTRYTGSPRAFFVQLAAIAIGIAAAVVISVTFDYNSIVKWWFVPAAVALVLVGLTFIIGYAPAGTDDKAWLKLPFNMSFQPSEILKIAFIITFAKHVSSIGERVNSLLNIIALCIHGAIPVMLIHIQGDDGTALVIAIIFISMMFAAGIRMRYFAIAGALAACAAPIAWFFVMNDDQRGRIEILFNPELDLYGSGWQQWRARIAMANGGFFGKGYLKGDFVQKGGVPEGYNDFIFASTGEELGTLGLIAIMAILLAVCIRILVIAHHSKDKQGVIICSGIFGMLAAQMILNIGMCVSLLPVIGITLPFFSAGGTSLIATYLGIGLVLNVYNHRNLRPMYLRDDF